MAIVRRIARWTRLVFASLYLVGIVVQFVLAGYGWFVEGGNFDVHEELGWTLMHLLPVLIFVAALVAWRPFADLGLSVAIGALGFIQPNLAAVGDWAGVFHPLNALVLFFLTHLLVRRDVRALRRPAPPPVAAAPEAEPGRV